MDKINKKDGINVIAELLLQSYEVDVGSVEYLIEESYKLGKNGPVSVICELLKKPLLTDIDRGNIRQFIVRAASTRRIKKAINRSIKRKGLCPANEREWLKNNIEPTKKIILDKVRKHISREIAVLNLNDVSGAINEFPEVIDRISRLEKNPRDLQISIGEFTYAATLAVIAQWILANDVVGKYEFINCSAGMEQYLNNIGFSSALRNPEIVISPDPMDWAVGITRINQDQPTHKVTNKIVDILETFMNPSPDDREALLVLISEMIENVHRHAKAKVDGFAVAQVYPKHLKMGITLVDYGIGISNSFREGDPSVSIEEFTTDEEFLREAVNLHSTSKTVRHSGYGLYLLSELIARNRGTMVLTSGKASLIGYQKKGNLTFDTYNHASWPGTIVSVIIDLKQKLPLTDIYDEMPLPEGFEEDDLFI